MYCFPTGRGAITQSTVTLNSSSFTAIPPNFTLYGDTSGGLPVEYTWTRNGAVITNNGSYHIYFELNTDATLNDYLMPFIEAH